MIRSKFNELRAKRAKKLGIGRLPSIDVANATGLSLQTMTRLSRNKFTAITTNTLDALCAYFECQPSDLLEYVPDPPAIGEEPTTSNPNAPNPKPDQK